MKLLNIGKLVIGFSIVKKQPILQRFYRESFYKQDNFIQSDKLFGLERRRNNYGIPVYWFFLWFIAFVFLIEPTQETNHYSSN